MGTYGDCALNALGAGRACAMVGGILGPQAGVVAGTAVATYLLCKCAEGLLDCGSAANQHRRDCH